MFRKQNECYKSLGIAAAPGTHVAVADMVCKYCVPNQSILELGAYTGAMIERLHDIGYHKIVAADLDNHLTISDVSHVQCDFNKEFSLFFGEQRFDCIIASEVIEHLNDVRAFLKQCFALLNNDGILIITTPNIGFFEGRVKFFLKGELWGFGAKNYLIQRHISPISLEQFPLLLQESGFSTLEIFTAASFATRLRKLVTSILWIPMRIIFGPFVLGETVVCIGKKSSESIGSFQSADLWKKSR
ncbi:class I SAM-dependent methyltransferase [Methylomonas sp. AM2-LC]|uniref:class I SAM-dependent methyltransferase n=1 Tax=Methylomonas sp. AM2-LC TaxID=3153301 RepID=UPI00326760CE